MSFCPQLALAVALLAIGATGCTAEGDPTADAQHQRPSSAGGTAMALELTSSTFEAGGAIPVRCTCEGDDVSPALSWSGAPEGTHSFALIVDDPDAPDPAAPQMTWVHWVAYDIPATTSSLAEGVAGGAMPTGTRAGTNDWQRTGFGGPCPPIGRHRYFHKLYALDTTLGDRGPLTKIALEQAMAGHVLAEAQLVGTYQKQRR